VGLKREDIVPIYKEDLLAKAERVREVVANLPDYKIPAIADVTKEDYDLVKLAVFNSAKGEIIAHEERSRQEFVERVYLAPCKKLGLLDYRDESGSGKCDFTGSFKNGRIFGLEVKGGEGNRVTLLHRPTDCKTFVVWSHLDVMSNTPSDNMRAVLGRLVKQLVNNDEKQEQIDFLVFYDAWYQKGIKRFRNAETLPDLFVFPLEIPTKSIPHPKMRDVEKSLFANSLYRVFGKEDGARNEEASKHIWLVDIELVKEEKWKRILTVRNKLDPKITFSEGESTRASCKPAD